MSARTRATLAALAVVLVAFAVAWSGRANEGRRALAECDQALARGDALDAILAARAAAEARCPGCSAPERGFGKLAAIAKAAEDKGDDVTAFAAWRAARAAALATGAPRDRADQEIARIGHRIDMNAVAAGAPATSGAAEEKLRVALATSSVPPLATHLLLAAGGALFLLGAARVASRGRRPADLLLAAAGAAAAAVALLLF